MFEEAEEGKSLLVVVLFVLNLSFVARIEKKFLYHFYANFFPSKLMKIIQKIPPVTKENLKETLPALYQEKVVPMEKHHEYDQFYSPPLTKAEFDSVPMVMFLGQYSVGKTTMIKYLIGEEYPNSKIGPDPTTDSFTVVNYAKSSHLTMGTTLVADPSKPFGVSYYLQL